MTRKSEETDSKPRAGRLGKVAAHLGLVVFGFALSFLAVELLLRALGLDKPAELGPTFDRPVLIYHPEGPRMNPWAAGHDDPLRIAVVGDSFTYGQGNHRYDAYPARLESLLNLNAGQRPAEVRVYAERGTSTRAQQKFLDRIGAWGPDILILGIFLNDAEVLKDESLRQMRTGLRPRIPTGRLAWVLRRSATLAWIYQRVENTRVSRASVEYYRHIYDPNYAGFQYFSQAIRTFRGVTKARGIQFLPVVFPGMARLGPDYPMDFVHLRINAVLEAERVEYLDLRDAFSNTLPIRMSAFPVVDPHPSEIAHRIAADAIFHRLLETRMIEPGYRPEQVEFKSREDWLDEVRLIKSVVHLAPE